MCDLDKIDELSSKFVHVYDEFLIYYLNEILIQIFHTSESIELSLLVNRVCYVRCADI